MYFNALTYGPTYPVDPSQGLYERLLPAGVYRRGAKAAGALPQPGSSRRQPIWARLQQISGSAEPGRICISPTAGWPGGGHGWGPSAHFDGGSRVHMALAAARTC